MNAQAIQLDFPPAQVEPLAHEYVRWIGGCALPLWAERPGANMLPIVERLNMTGQDERPGFLRLRVISGLLAVYSQASRWEVPGASAMAESLWQCLLQCFWNEADGWHASVDENGAPIAGAFTLDEQAFALCACANRAQISPFSLPENLALRTLDIITERLGAGEGCGWQSAPGDEGFDQRPHMHLLEAMLVLHDARPSAATAGAIESLLELVKCHLVDGKVGAIVEHFDSQWKMRSGAADVVPGYQYQWLWLSAEARRLGFTPGWDETALARFAERHGWSAHSHLIVDGCALGGSQTCPDHHLWPHCQAVRAGVVMADNKAGQALVEQALHALFNTFLDQPFAGGWVDRIDLTGNQLSTFVPASSLYCLWSAAEALLQAGWVSPSQVRQY